jgi:hypothetical protein
MCSTEQAAYMEEKRKEMSDEELMFFVESIIDSGNIQQNPLLILVIFSLV